MLKDEISSFATHVGGCWRDFVGSKQAKCWRMFEKVHHGVRPLNSTETVLFITLELLKLKAPELGECWGWGGADLAGPGQSRVQAHL